jgi:hypothetical protein
MKAIFAALLLLTQLQPVLGAVACLGLSQPKAAECEMTEDGKAPSQNGPESATHPLQACPFAAVCTPLSPAIPGLSNQVETSVQIHTGVASTGSNTPVEVFSSPPFHPPRA